MYLHYQLAEEYKQTIAKKMRTLEITRREDFFICVRAALPGTEVILCPIEVNRTTP